MFNDLLSGISPETGYPDDFIELATGAYDQDTAAANAKIAELSAQLEAAQAELQTQKVINYDLMAAAASVPVEGEEPATVEDEQPDDDNPDDIDSLFESKDN